MIIENKKYDVIFDAYHLFIESIDWLFIKELINGNLIAL